jgi:hypothetical protein
MEISLQDFIEIFIVARPLRWLKKILYNWAVKKRYRDDDTTETWQKSILTISMTIGNEPIGDILSDKN